MYKLILVLLLLKTSTILFAQTSEEIHENRPVKSINLNLLGDASLISIHGDRQIFLSSAFMLSGKLGIGYNEEFQICLFGPCSSPSNKYITVPHHITGNYGKGKHFFEFGAGGTFVLGETTQPYNIYPILGYRFSPLETGKFNFRIFVLIPFIESDDYFLSPVGLSLGKSF